MNEMTSSPSNKTVELLREEFGEKIRTVEVHYDMTTVTVSKEAIKDVIRFLKSNSELDYNFLTTCCGLHFPDAEEKFGMMYQMHCMRRNERIRLKCFTNEEHPVFPSLTDIFSTANWMEREAYDFFGFKFTGHPDMRRILNMDSLEGWPLRKEYPLEDPFRMDKDDKMFGRELNAPD